MNPIQKIIIVLIFVLIKTNSFSQTYKQTYKILKQTYNSKNDYLITKIKYYNPFLGRDVIINVITSPKAEYALREKYDNYKSNSGKSSDNTENLNNENTSRNNDIEIKKTKEDFTTNKDTIVKSSKQYVYEFDENNNFQKIENSGIKLVGNRVNSQFSGELIKNDIDKKSEEYFELLLLDLKKGIYIIEKNLNKENEIISFRIVPVKIQIQDE